MDIKYEIKGKSNFKPDYRRHVTEYSNNLIRSEYLFVENVFMYLSKVLIYVQIHFNFISWTL